MSSTLIKNKFPIKVWLCVSACLIFASCNPKRLESEKEDYQISNVPKIIFLNYDIIKGKEGPTARMHLSSGIYFIHLHFASGLALSNKVIKQ